MQHCTIPGGRVFNTSSASPYRTVLWKFNSSPHKKRGAELPPPPTIRKEVCYSFQANNSLLKYTNCSEFIEPRSRIVSSQSHNAA